MKEVVELLIEKHKRIATMESCTGGFIASSITDIDGSSEILSFSAVTYFNDTRYDNKIFIKENIAISLLKMIKKEEENN